MTVDETIRTESVRLCVRIHVHMTIVFVHLCVFLYDLCGLVYVRVCNLYVCIYVLCMFI